MALQANIMTPGVGLRSKLCEILGFDPITGTKTVIEPGGYDDEGNKKPDKIVVQKIEDTVVYQSLVKLIDYFVQFNEINTLPTGVINSPTGVVSPLQVIAGLIPGPGVSLPTPTPVNLTGTTIIVPPNPATGGPVK